MRNLTDIRAAFNAAARFPPLDEQQAMALLGLCIFITVLSNLFVLESLLWGKAKLCADAVRNKNVHGKHSRTLYVAIRGDKFQSLLCIICVTILCIVTSFTPLSLPKFQATIPPHRIFGGHRT